MFLFVVFRGKQIPTEVRDTVKITDEYLKFPQIDFSFRYLYDNNLFRPNGQIFEFGTGRGISTRKICQYLIDNNMSEVEVYSFDCFQGLIEESSFVEVFPKYVPGAYKVEIDNPAETIQRGIGYTNLCVIECYFDKLHDIIDTCAFTNTLLVHVDCDLFISTKQCLSWLFDNELVQVGTLFAFDEFKSTYTTRSGGESLAWYEALVTYGIAAKEIFHYIYKDKDCNMSLRQNVMEVTSVHQD